MAHIEVTTYRTTAALRERIDEVIKGLADEFGKHTAEEHTAAVTHVDHLDGEDGDDATRQMSSPADVAGAPS